MTYSEKLRLPQWQKKRLQILERDGWKCQSCNATDKNLQVHHLVYGRKEPWEYPDGCYQTLCEECHSVRQEFSDKASNAVKMALRNVATEKLQYFLDDIIGRALSCDDYRQHMVNILHESLNASKAGRGPIPDGLFSDAVPALLESQLGHDRKRAITLLRKVIEALESGE